MMFINKNLKEQPPSQDPEVVEDRQVQAYYLQLMNNVGFSVRLPVPLRGKSTPSEEDYQKSLQVFRKTKEILLVMGYKVQSDEERLTMQVMEKEEK